MLIRHTAMYLVGRLLPAGINLAAFIAYAHLVSAQEFGRFAVAVAIANIINLSAFQWLKLALARYGAASQADGTLGLTPLLTFGCLAVGVGIANGIYGFTVDSERAGLLLLAAGVGVSMAWAELCQEWLRARLAVRAYNRLFMARAVLGLGFSVGLAHLERTGAALLVAAIAANVTATLPGLRSMLQQAAQHPFSKSLLQKHVRYGLPLAGSLTLNSVAGEAEKLMLGLSFGAAAVAPFAATKEPVRSAVTLVGQAATIGAFPLAVRDLHRHGRKRAAVHLRLSGLLLLAVSTPLAVGAVVAGADLLYLVLPLDYAAEGASLLLPLVVAALLQSWRAFYADQAFMLGSSSAGQIKVAAVGLACTTGFAAVLIPTYGPLGAAWAAALGALVGLLLSWQLGRKVFPLAMPRREVWKISFACGLMGLVTLGLHGASGGQGAPVLLIGCGALTYFAALAGVNFQRFTSRTLAGLRAERSRATSATPRGCGGLDTPAKTHPAEDNFQDTAPKRPVSL